MFSSKQLLD